MHEMQKIFEFMFYSSHQFLLVICVGEIDFEVLLGQYINTASDLYLGGRLNLKCDGTCAETRFCLSAKQTSPFKSVEASVRSTTGSRGVRIGGSDAVYTMF
jgi:hypothetical protein